MVDRVCRLSSEGMRAFSAWIRAGAPGPVPNIFLMDATVAVPLTPEINITDQIFEGRFQFGEFLSKLLCQLDPREVSYDRGLWTWIAVRFFEQLCALSPDGERKLRPEYAYVLSEDFRHYYRHLVRTPWYLVTVHGDNAKFMLESSQAKDPSPLARHSDLLEQLGSRQMILGSPSLIAAANRIYSDPKTGRPFPGTGGKGRGSPRRLRDIANQLALTFDTRDMGIERLISLLPKEFSIWLNRAGLNPKT